MTKTKRQQAAPLEALHKHFSANDRWGERWTTSLYPALIKQTRYATLYNRYAIEGDFSRAIGDVTALTRLELPRAIHEHVDDERAEELQCFIRKTGPEGQIEQAPFPLPARSSNGITTHWNLDAASLLAVQVLGIRQGDRTLDLCAAPGGKSIALAQNIWPGMKPGRASGIPLSGCIHSNEFDRARHQRLDANMRLYLPVLCVSAGRVKCLQLDGTKGAQYFPLGVGGYDKVLLDAPCSSERHILQAQERLSGVTPPRTADELARWTPSSSKRMADTQLQLLMTAIRAVRIGGKVLYATCSISQEENDSVVEKAIKQFNNEQRKGTIKWIVELTTLDSQLVTGLEAWAEKTSHGWIVLPDHPTPYGAGWGPLYFSSISKISVHA